MSLIVSFVRREVKNTKKQQTRKSSIRKEKMASLYEEIGPAKVPYLDKQFAGTPEEYWAQLANSTSLYVGNLSFFTTEEQIYELFRKCGEVRRQTPDIAFA